MTANDARLCHDSEMEDAWPIVSALAALLVSIVLLWVKSAIASRNESQGENTRRAHWEGRQVATVESIKHEVDRLSAQIDRMDERLRSMPAPRAPKGGA